MSEDHFHAAQDVLIAGHSNPKSPRTENSFIESLRISLKDGITSEIKTLPAESQKEMLSLLKSRANANSREEPENETRSFFTPTKPVRLNSTHNNNSYAGCTMVTEVLNDSTNQPKKAKIRSQSQPASKQRPAAARALFATDKNDGTTLLLPKALTASLPTFDGKSKKNRTI